MTLDRLRIGETAIIRSVRGESPLRLRLLDMGLIPRTKITMRKTAPMGDPIEINVRGYELTLRLHDAKNIEIETQSSEYCQYGRVCPYGHANRKQNRRRQGGRMK